MQPDSNEISGFIYATRGWFVTACCATLLHLRPIGITTRP